MASPKPLTTPTNLNTQTKSNKRYRWRVPGYVTLADWRPRHPTTTSTTPPATPPYAPTSYAPPHMACCTNDMIGDDTDRYGGHRTGILAGGCDQYVVLTGTVPQHHITSTTSSTLFQRRSTSSPSSSVTVDIQPSADCREDGGTSADCRIDGVCAQDVCTKREKKEVDTSSKVVCRACCHHQCCDRHLHLQQHQYQRV